MDFLWSLEAVKGGRQLKLPRMAGKCAVGYCQGKSSPLIPELTDSRCCAYKQALRSSWSIMIMIFLEVAQLVPKSPSFPWPHRNSPWSFSLGPSLTTIFLSLSFRPGPAVGWCAGAHDTTPLAQGEPFPLCVLGAHTAFPQKCSSFPSPPQPWRIYIKPVASLCDVMFVTHLHTFFFNGCWLSLLLLNKLLTP